MSKLLSSPDKIKKNSQLFMFVGSAPDLPGKQTLKAWAPFLPKTYTHCTSASLEKKKSYIPNIKKS